MLPAVQFSLVWFRFGIRNEAFRIDGKALIFNAWKLFGPLGRHPPPLPASSVCRLLRPHLPHFLLFPIRGSEWEDASMRWFYVLG